MPKKLHKLVNHSIDKLHTCMSKSKFEKTLAKLEKEWKEIKELDAFRVYFFKHWIDGSDTKWSLYHVPVGFCNTNNSLESYNNKFNTHFTLSVL